MPRWIFLLPFCFPWSSLYAQESAPSPAASSSPGVPPTSERILTAEERNQLTERAKQLQAEVEQRRAEADRVHESAKTQCWKKFLVSDCLDEARVAYRKEMAKIAILEREVRALERDVKRHESADRAVKREARNAERDAKMEAKAEQYRAKQAEEEAKRERKQQEPR